MTSPTETIYFLITVLQKRFLKMSKSKRVFLTIMGDADFWGNGDGMRVVKKSEKKKKKQKEKQVEEVEAEYYFDALEKGFNEEKLRASEGEEEEEEDEEDEEDDEEEKMFSEEEKSDQKDSGVMSATDSAELFHTDYRNFLKNRPEAEMRALLEGPFDVMADEKFFELYKAVRKSFIGDIVIQQLRRNASSTQGGPTPLGSGGEQRVQTKHAVVVSNFREPDRRLGRNLKYYYHHNVGPEVYSRKVFVGGLPACVTEVEILTYFSRFGRLQVDWPSKHYAFKSDSDPSMSSSESQSNVNNSQQPSSLKPTSHLAMVSPPFGQINPFLNDFASGGMYSTSSVEVGVGGEKRQKHLGYVFLLFEKERSVRDLVAECFEEEAGLFISLDDCLNLENVRVQIRPWLLADAEFLMDFNVAINTKLVAFIGGVPRPLKAVELAHFFEQTYGNVVCVGIDIDNKFKYPRGSGRVAFSNYEAYVNAITDRYIVLDHEDIHKRIEIKPYFFHNQSCEECSGRYHRQHAPFFCPSLECFQYYCEPCWHKMHTHPSRFHHMPVVKGV